MVKNNNKYDELELKRFDMDTLLPDATVLLLGRRRSGKCLAKGTKILMYDGTTQNIENIQKGDHVMGDDSTIRTVIDTHNGHDIMYTITNQFNESYTVNSQHTLSLIIIPKLSFNNIKTIKGDGFFKISYIIQNNNNKTILKYKKIYYTDDNYDDIYYKSLDILNNKTNIINIPIEEYFKIPNKYKKFIHGYQKPIHFSYQTPDIDPILLGFLLNKNYRFTKDAKILLYLNKNLRKYNSYLSYNTQTNLYEIHGPIIDIDLSNYLWKNIKNTQYIRLQLLYAFLKINQYFLNHRLKKDIHYFKEICFLIKSLGYSIYSDTHFIYIYNHSNQIQTEFDLQTPLPNIILNKLDIKKEVVSQYYGFQLDGNHLFMLDNCIVTHNSWLVRDIFYHHRHIPSGIVFSGTEEANPFFKDFIPDIFIHSEYNPDLVEAVMNKQKKNIRAAKELGIKDGKCPANNKFIVLDDMLHDAQKWKNDTTIKNIFFNGRHYNFLFILTMQYTNGIQPGLRSNIDYVFIFNEPSTTNRKKIYNDYCSSIPSFEIFCNILDACTTNHECVVVKTSTNSNVLTDSVFYYKAKSHSHFRAGHRKFWKYHKTNYNNNYEDEHI